MLLDGGRAADGTVVISEAQRDAMLTPSTTNPAYGRLWWLNGGAYAIAPGRGRTEGPLIATAPADLYAALGAQDRKLYVVPSRRLVVVRAGPAVDDAEFNETLWRLISAAMPEA
jgi:hypothetical protein